MVLRTIKTVIIYLFWVIISVIFTLLCIPVAIVVVNKIFPKKRLVIDSNCSTVKLIICKPFYYNDDEKEKAFVKRVYDWFAVMLERNKEVCIF